MADHPRHTSHPNTGECLLRISSVMVSIFRDRGWSFSAPVLPETNN